MIDKLRGEKPLISQAEIGPRLGGAKTALQRLQTYIGIVSKAMIAAVFYQSVELYAFAPKLPVLGTLPIGPTLFPNLVVYFAWCALGVLVVAYLDIRYVLGSEKHFHNLQAETAERSPVKADTEAIRGVIERDDIQLVRTDGSGSPNERDDE
jgi:hypothetical protein